ncbi:MAG: 50S ribosomal protein L13 [Thermodesulfovibrionales bacterium]|nr:50S ribosomal protein L13 [Thermodesulfovibrionales bacterium]
MKTCFTKKEDAKRDWYLIDAKDKVLGRMAAEIALRLRGKHKPIFTPNADTGDFVVVINAEKVKVTGKKLRQKVYYWHTGYIGNLKSATLQERLNKHPEEVIRDAVWGMLPKTRLGRQLIKKLKVYKGEAHPHIAQKPEEIKTFSKGE